MFSALTCYNCCGKMLHDMRSDCVFIVQSQLYVIYICVARNVCLCQVRKATHSDDRRLCDTIQRQEDALL